MLEKNDWRLTGQDKYLKGVPLYRKEYVAPGPDWDHDHCEFCWATFMDSDRPDIQREGYTTKDNKKWICSTCYEDFKVMFAWSVKS
jgi:hypothetical protein